MESGMFIQGILLRGCTCTLQAWTVACSGTGGHPTLAAWCPAAGCSCWPGVLSCHSTASTALCRWDQEQPGPCRQHGNTRPVDSGLDE